MGENRGREIGCQTGHVIVVAVRIDGPWAFAAVRRSRWHVLNGCLTRRLSNGPKPFVVRFPAGGLDEPRCELIAVCLALLAVRDGDEAFLSVLPETRMLIESVVAGAEPRLSGETRLLDEVRPRLADLVFFPRETRSRYPDPRSALEAMLPASGTDPVAVRTLEDAANAVRIGIRNGAGLPVHDLTERGFTTDYGRANHSACAFVDTDRDGRATGDVFAVRLPAVLDSHWGEIVAVLLTFIHARNAGQGRSPVYTDAAAVVQRLRELRLLRRSAPPALIALLLNHDRLRGIKGIDARWVRRSGTDAQRTVDQTVRHVSATGHVTLHGVRELRLDLFLPKH
ncbi:hypothetical protein ACFYT4_31655 [Streptomyces sp. NPDC004609]|uniref:hypothetical protein n=1 Tax=Streptomyces sp. NPDC004609 TaxID=3364704 RepID=UPI0036862282